MAKTAVLPERLDDWYALWVKSRQVTPERAKSDERRYSKYIEPKFGDMPVQRITSRLVQNWLNQKTLWQNSQGEIQEATKYASLMVLRQILDLPAQKRGPDGQPVIRKNPTDGLRVEEAPTGIQARGEDEVLPRDVAETVVANMDEHYRPLGLLALRLGVTWAEAMGLELKDVDIPHKRITIGRRLGIETGGQVEVRDRTAADPPDRSVDMPADLKNALAVYIAETQEIRGKAPWLFITPNPGKDGPRRPLRPNWNRYVLRPALRAAGLDERVATFHTLRHTAARNMLEDGVSVERVQVVLGHKSVNTTKRYYKSFIPAAA